MQDAIPNCGATFIDILWMCYHLNHIVYYFTLLLQMCLKKQQVTKHYYVFIYYLFYTLPHSLGFCYTTFAHSLGQNPYHLFKVPITSL